MEPIDQTFQGTVYSAFPLTLLTPTNPIQPQTRTHNIDGKHLLHIENLFSEDECTNIIRLSETCGYESLAHIYPEDYRNNTRVIVEDKHFTDIWYGRLRETIATTFPNPTAFVGLNSRIRLCKYSPGGKFAAHYDSPISHDGQTSIYTVMAYLNDVNEEAGGATRFYSEVAPETPPVCISPRRGSVVVFRHDIAHDGEELREGMKYIMRTDVMVSETYGFPLDPIP
jgi:hypothetical protein